MAVLEAKDLTHGPVEVLITTDEETGMPVPGFATRLLKAPYILNRIPRMKANCMWLCRRETAL
jgi:hypothetical protein